MENVLAELRFDPFDYVAALQSPIGIYLRGRISKNRLTSDDILTRELYGKIVADQSADGSWDHLFVRTANNLWNLALLDVDAKDKSVSKGLEWLRSIQRHTYRGIYPGFFDSGNRRDPSAMRSTPYGEFGPGCSLFYQTTYAVHLFHIFGFDDDSQIQTTINSYLRIWGNQKRYCGVWCTLNVLRILIEHPLSRESRQVENGLKGLARRQTKTGAWKDFPYYHTLHALSRSQHPLASEQLKKAFPSLVRRQKKDGSWGSDETTTFLVLDALKNANAM